MEFPFVFLLIADESLLRSTSNLLLLSLLMHHVLPSLNQPLFALPFHTSDPHDPLFKQLLRSVLIMTMVYFIDIFRALIFVVEVKDFLSRYYGVIVTENE